MGSAAFRIEDVFKEHLDVARASMALEAEIERAAELLTGCLVNGNTILLCGNGGSAADAQHLAGEWVGRFLMERRGLPAIALHTNTTAVTAIANDYGYDEVFARQVEAHGRKGDVLIALTTSGNSENVVRAASKARMQGMDVIGMTGENHGRLGEHSHVCLAIPSSVTARVQEMHIVIGHMLCEITEQNWKAAQA